LVDEFGPALVRLAKVSWILVSLVTGRMEDDCYSHAGHSVGPVAIKPGKRGGILNALNGKC
jgi:hypothetical protein